MATGKPQPKDEPAAEARFRQLATVLWDSGDAITVHDFDGRITTWNRGAERMYGYAESEARKMNIRDLVPEENRADALAYVERLRRNETVAAFTTRRVTRGGEILDVDLTITSCLDELGQPIAVCTTERNVTEQLRLARSLQQLNESLEQRVDETTREVRLLAEAIAHLGEGVVITADELEWPGPQILFVNDAMCRITGYLAEELIGKSPRILQGNGTDAARTQHLRSELEAGRSCSVEVVNYRKDGTPYDAELFVTPLFDPHRRRTNFVSVHRDISERKGTERLLQEQEALARSVFDSLSAHIAVINQQGEIIRVNAAWDGFATENSVTDLRQTGVGSNYIEVCQRAAALGDEVALKVLGGLQDLLAQRISEFTMEYPCHAACEKRWFALSVTPISSPPGGAVISHVAITDRKLAELALQSEQELSENVIETSQVIVLVLDLEGRVLRINHYMEKLTGWKQEEVKGLDWFETFLPTKDREGIRNVFRRAVAGEPTTGNVYSILTKAGLLREIEWFDAPLSYGADKCGGLLCTGKDVTEEKREARRREAQYQLTRVLAEAETVDDAIPEVLKIICTGLGWRLGEMWSPDAQDNLFRCRFIWHDATRVSREFESATRETVCSPGNSLIGRVWSRHEPVWIPDVRVDSGFCRAESARKAGIHAAFAFPIPSNGQVTGVMAFFATEQREPDARLLDQMETFGKQVGDFIQRRMAEKALHANEEQMRAILETAADAIITINYNGIITSVNPSTLRMFGYEEQDLIGRNVNVLMPTPSHNEHDGYITRYLETGQARIIGIGREVVAKRKDETLFPAELAVSQLVPLGLFNGVIRDISDRKELERQVLEIAADEQRRIGQELHDGTGGELTGLSLFAATLIDQLDEALKKATGDESARLVSEAEMLRLRQTASRLSQGLNDAYQHVKKLSHGIMPVQIEAEGLSSALDELATATNGQHKVSCHFDYPAPAEIANNTTATHLYRIAQEAVNNALRHGKASQIRISLLQIKGETILEVMDNGVGFDPSSFARSRGSGVTGGFGLGIMAYRAGIIGGTLRTMQLDEGGILVRCAIPAGGGNQQ